MFLVRLGLRLLLLVCVLALAAYVFACATNAQGRAERDYQPELRRALGTRTMTDKPDAARPDAYTPRRNLGALKQRPAGDASGAATRRS